MFKIQTCPCLGGAVESVAHKISIVRMNSLDYQLECGLNRSIVSKDIVGFVRPVDFTTRNVPAETASAAQTLRLRQVSLVLAERLLGPLKFGPLCGFTQRPQPRRHKPRQPRLQNIIRCPNLERFDRYLFAQ